MAEAARGQATTWVVVDMELVLVVVLLAVVLTLSGGPPLSKSMNHMSFPRENHKHDSFCHHVQLTKKMYSTNFLLW